MDTLTTYSLGNWVYGVVTSLIAAILFAVGILALRWLWRWMRNFSAGYRRADQANRIIKIFVYRRYIGKRSMHSLSRGEFFVIARCLQMFIAGVAFAAMGSFLAWITSMQIGFYMFLGLAVWMFVEAISWLDSRWSRKALERVDEQALSDAAAILGEEPDDVRSHVTGENA